MKSTFLLGVVLMHSFSHLFCQAPASPAPKYLRFQGVYQAEIDTTVRFRILAEGGKIILAIDGQGQTDMTEIGENRFKPNVIRKTEVEFMLDSLGRVNGMQWIQPLDLVWNKKKDSSTNVNQAADTLHEYLGTYTNGKQNLRISQENGHLYSQANQEGQISLVYEAKDRYTVHLKHGLFVFTFRRDKSGAIRDIATSRTGGVDFVKLDERSPEGIAVPHIGNRDNGFNRADSLRGFLSPLRTVYDVVFYDLDVEILPQNKKLKGHCMIRFKAVRDLARMQIDLYGDVAIEKILYQGVTCQYQREADAVFVDLPQQLSAGNTGELTVYYSGRPQEPNLTQSMVGGFLWLTNTAGKPWIESVCQGSGASLWWPCKDHLSDKPDSMMIRVTVPEGLKDVSNGRLVATTQLPEHRVRFDWSVGYPINNYNVVVNIGDYESYSDEYEGQTDSFALHFYFMPYNLDKAKILFAQVKPMIARYEKLFGPYPFPKDGFTVMEAPYPMEHQSAVSVGQFANQHWDEKEMRRLMWHECAHEWWGNSVTCADMADFWMHEAFATYAEYLNTELLTGKEASLIELNKQKPGNKEPVIGVYGVNHIHYEIGDVYSKGSLMLNTLRHLINNDSSWFALLRGIQAKFRYQSISSAELIAYIGQSTGKDLSWFFDQYLTKTSIPELQYSLVKDKNDLMLQYRWDHVTDSFRLPVRVINPGNPAEFIFPTTAWQTTRLPGRQKKDFALALNEYYIRAVEVKPGATNQAASSR